MNYYEAYDLVFQSELKIPELNISTNKNFDVQIIFNTIKHDLSGYKKNRIWETKENEFILSVKNIGDFHVKNGNTIIIQPFENTKYEDLCFVLLGSVFAALLQQRKLLTLHSGAIKTENGALLFMGASGNGKSTLTTAFSILGYEIFSDDIVALDIKPDSIEVRPSFPKLKLWEDSAKNLSLDYEKFVLTRGGLHKYMVKVPPSKFSKSKQRVKKIYLLNTHNKKEIILEKLEGSQKIKALLDNTYRIKFLSGMNLAQHHHQQIMQVASQIEVVKITRPLEIFLIDELVNKIQEDNK